MTPIGPGEAVNKISWSGDEEVYNSYITSTSPLLGGAGTTMTRHYINGHTSNGYRFENVLTLLSVLMETF